MKYTSRTVIAMTMLIGVCALAVVSVLAVLTAVVLAARAGGVWAILAAVSVVAALVGVGMVLLAARRRQGKPVHGVLISGDEEPLLWVEICIVAEGLHMWPPSELVLAPDASLVASENRTWLGLRPGVRRLQLGEVLLAGLTERQLRAAVAHELLRVWRPRSSARFIHRGRKLIGRVLDLVGQDSRAGRIVGRYGRALVAVSDPVIRSYQLDADRLGANLVGNGSTLSALQEIAVLSRAWEEFVGGYLAPALAVRRRPEDVFASFAQFLEYPGRREELAAAIGEPQPRPLSRYDFHPSLAERLAAVLSLPDDGTRDRSGRAVDMLREPDRVIRHVREWMFQDREVIPTRWEEIVPEAGRAAARDNALRLVHLGNEGGLGPTLSVMNLLDIIRYGLAPEMVRPLLDEGAAEEVEREMAGRLVTAFLTSAAIETGSASYRFSWAAPWQLVDTEGEVEELPGLVDAALADPSEVAALERWLGAHKLSAKYELGDDSGPDATHGPSGASAEKTAGDPIPVPRSVLVP
jgi:hypothetical protein